MKRPLESGQVFAHLTALQPSPVGQNMHWDFQCQCGRVVRMYKYPVLAGRNKSCGCANSKQSALGISLPRHGDTGTRLHNVWRGMVKRCSPNFPDPEQKYRARGIVVCEEWQTYENFKAWALANGYADDLTIDREDNDGNYEPSNCRWSARKDQARNRRTSRLLTINGKEQTLAAWSEETGVGQSLISHRLRVGWPVEQAVMQPANPKLTGRPRLK